MLQTGISQQGVDHGTYNQDYHGHTSQTECNVNYRPELIYNYYKLTLAVNCLMGLISFIG